LYSLRYETYGGNRIPEIKQLLRANKVREDRVKLLDVIFDYAGTAKRTKEVSFGGSDLFTGIVTMVKGSVTQVENALTQHKPMMAKTIEEAKTGRLMESRYPAATSVPVFQQTGNAQQQPGTIPAVRELIILMLGGATYEEAAYVANVNNSPAMGSAPQFKVLLGGTFLHNSKTFLEELSTLGSTGL